MRIKWWLLFERGVNTRRDIQLEKIVSEYDAKGGGRERANKRLKLLSESSSDKSTSLSLPMLASFSQSYSLILLCKRLFPSRRTCQTITITNLLNDPPQTKRNMIFYPDISFFLIENYIKTQAAYRFMDT